MSYQKVKYYGCGKVAVCELCTVIASSYYPIGFFFKKLAILVMLNVDAQLTIIGHYVSYKHDMSIILAS
jgi:hypothetical protein